MPTKKIKWDVEDKVTNINSRDDIIIAVDHLKNQETLLKAYRDGVERVRNRKDYADKLDAAGWNLKLDVDEMKSFDVDRLIKTQLGGKRQGLTIVWEISEDERYEASMDDLEVTRVK